MAEKQFRGREKRKKERERANVRERERERKRRKVEKMKFHEGRFPVSSISEYISRWLKIADERAKRDVERKGGSGLE